MPTVTYRQLTASGEPLWGEGQANFVADKLAVAQAVLTRLRLFQGEWWAATGDGLALFQSILGASGNARSQQKISILITARILGTPFVSSVSNVQVAYAPATRGFAYTATVLTKFGAILVTNAPQPPSGALPL